MLSHDVTALSPGLKIIVKKVEEIMRTCCNLREL